MMLALLQAAPLVHGGVAVDQLDLKHERDIVLGALRRTPNDLKPPLASLKGQLQALRGALRLGTLGHGFVEPEVRYKLRSLLR